MPTDKFKISSDILDPEDLQHKLGTLAPLRRIIDLIIDTEKPDTVDQFNEDFSRETVSIIEVNVQKLWDSKEQYPDDNKKFNQAKFTFTNFSDAPQNQQWIYGLNRGVLRSAVWEMLSNNYVFDQKPYHFITELPPSSGSQLKLSRTDQTKGTQLTLEFSRQIQELFDVSQNKSLKLDAEDILYPVINGTFNPAAQDPIFCETKLMVTIDITHCFDIDIQKPQITIELTVHSNCPRFRYAGGWTPEITQLENVDMPAEPAPALTTRFNIYTTTPAISAVISGLESAHQNIAVTIEKIISTNHVPVEHLTPALCSAALHLFNESLKIALLKTQHSNKPPNELNGLNYFSTYLKSLTIQISNRKGAAGNPLLVEKAWLELINIFYKLKDTQTSQLLAVFYGMPASQIKNGAFFIHQNFKDFSAKYQVAPLTAREITYIIFVAFESIKAALKSVQTEKRTHTFGFDPEGTTNSIFTIEGIPIAFKQYLQSMASRTLVPNPLDNHLLNGIDFPPITTIKFFGEEISEIQEICDNTDLVITRKFQVLHLKIQRQEQNRQALLQLARDRNQSNLHDQADKRNEKALHAESDLNFNWLLEKGADLNFSDATRQLPVVVAMHNQNKHIFNRIIQHEKFNIEAIDVPSQLTILEIASDHPDPYYQRSLERLLSQKISYAPPTEELSMTFSYNNRRYNTYIQTAENLEFANSRHKTKCCTIS